MSRVPRSRLPVCPTTGKSAYRTRAKATAYAEKMREVHPDQRPQRPYSCPECVYWHLSTVKRKPWGVSPK